MELVESENAGYEAYHWWIDDGCNIGLYQCYDCGCIKYVGSIEVPAKIDILDEDDDEIESILMEIDNEIGGNNCLMYLYKPNMHSCGCSKYEEEE